jgi:magnesium transporter
MEKEISIRIAGVGGMSEFSMMTTGIDWWISYPLFTGAMFIIGLVTYFIVNRIRYEKRERKRKNGFAD